MREGRNTEGPIRVLIADDHAMFRRGVGEMLSTDEGIEVVGEARNGREAVALAEELRPELVLLDVEMPLMGAREAMKRMLANPLALRVIIVTMHDEPRVVRELIGLGASAYLVKSATMEELHEAVHNAARSLMGPGEDVVMVAPPSVLEEREEADGLSGRELEVLVLVARGMSNHQIAASLHLSEATVKRHLANVYPKIGVSSRGEAVRVALSKGWISPREITDAPGRPQGHRPSAGHGGPEIDAHLRLDEQLGSDPPSHYNGASVPGVPRGRSIDGQRGGWRATPRRRG